jgi:hypothetical protein
MADRRQFQHPTLHSTVEVCPLDGSLPGTFMPVIERVKGPADLIGGGDCTIGFMDGTFELEEEDGWFYPSDGERGVPRR